MLNKKISLLILCNTTLIFTTELVEIRTVNKNIAVDHRYASNRNFAGKALYTYPGMFVERATAQALSNVQTELEQKYGYSLLIWDGYRSKDDQRKLYQAALIIDGALNHVSNPDREKSYKSAGDHVELTLIDRNGNLLPMPTDFDELSEKARSDYIALPKHVLQNRALLHEIMQKHGFANFEKEWWYFYYLHSDNAVEIEASAADLEKLVTNKN